jgi:hypothetical protein
VTHFSCIAGNRLSIYSEHVLDMECPHRAVGTPPPETLSSSYGTGTYWILTPDKIESEIHFCQTASRTVSSTPYSQDSYWFPAGAARCKFSPVSGTEARYNENKGEKMQLSLFLLSILQSDQPCRDTLCFKERG